MHAGTAWENWYFHTVKSQTSHVMIYYNTLEYNERYFVRFKDVDGNDWRISIQDPTFEGTATELTGAAEPIDWEGNGDASQDEVFCGTTGRIRFICTDSAQASIFTIGNLLPENINDRRVQLMRYTNIGGGVSQFECYWQGFIKPDVYTQDWDMTPYEIELPIVSVVAALEYFPMPLPNENVFGLFDEQTNIGGLVRAICIACGCDIRYILTNKPIYEDFNGQKQLVPGQEYYAHWSQGIVSSMYYYDIDSGIMKPKTLKYVLENICYPYGKIQDVYKGIAILMRWKADAASGAKLYNLPVWTDYDNQVISTTTRFSEFSSVNTINLTDVATAGTDNTFSLIARPRNVKFAKDINTSKEIFEFSDEFIKPSLPIGSTLNGNEYVVDTGTSISGVRRYLYAINTDFVNTGFATNWTLFCSQESLQNYAFCRVVEVSGDNDSNQTSVTVPLGLCLNANAVNSSTGSALIAFTLANGVKTISGMNTLKFSIKPYIINLKDPAYEYPNPIDNPVILVFSIQDTKTGNYLIYDSNEGKWVWQNSSATISFDDLTDESNEWSLVFNEDRQSNDNSLHKLRFGFVARASNNLGNTYGRMFLTFKLEYSEVPAATNQSIAAVFAESLQRNGNTIEYGGSGEELTITFETQCGTKNNVIDGSVMLPFNSFCNAQTYIDTQNREQIEIEAAKFQRYNTSGVQLFDLVTSYAVIKDGTKVYIPVAVGMNPRMNTLKLRLVSTNVTS